MKSILYSTYANEDDEIQTNLDVCNFLSSIRYDIGNKILLIGNIENLGNRLKSKGLCVTVVDDTQRNEVCYSLVKNNNCDFIRSCLHHIPFSDNYFDKIIILEHFNTISNNKTAIEELKRVLKEEGEVIIEDFSLKSLKIKLKNLKHKMCGEKNCYQYPHQILNLFLNYGFEGNLKEVSNERYIYIGKKIKD